MCVLIFCKIMFETFLVLERFQRDVITNVRGTVQSVRTVTLCFAHLSAT